MKNPILAAFAACFLPVSLALSLAVLSLAPVSAHAQSLGFNITTSTPGTPSDHLAASVVDDVTHAPIPDAQISITSDAQGSYLLSSDENGAAFTYLNEASSPKTVTISKDGYSTMTIIGVEGDTLTVFLRALVNPQTSIVSGVIQDWDGMTTGDSSILQAGFVFKTASPEDLLAFQMSDFISPLQDTINLGLIGNENIPSNLVLPDQTVNYIFNFGLDKPVYRLSIPNGKTMSVTGVEAQGNVGDVVNALGKKFDIALLNKLQFKRAGMTPTFTAAGNLTENVTANETLVPEHQVSLADPPPFSADVIAVSFVDVNGDKQTLVPSDVKALIDQSNPNESQSSVSVVGPETLRGGATRAVATIALGSHGEISGALVEPAEATVVAKPFLATPALSASATLPSTVTIHSPAQGVGAAIFSTNQPVWYVYTLPVAGDVSYSTAPLQSISGLKSYSLNQLEFSAFDATNVDGDKIMNMLQRYARSGAKIGQ